MDWQVIKSCPDCSGPFDGDKCWKCGYPDTTVQKEGNGWSTHYYELPPEAAELQDLIEYREMNFSLGNIFKACWRIGEKDGTDEIYDLNKIIWFAQRELDRRLK
jgi:hypothetical protein